MSEFILLAETGADIPAELAAQYNIQTVPMHVAFGDETRDDGTFPIRAHRGLDKNQRLHRRRFRAGL